MKYRAFGHSGIKIAPLALGGNVFGWTIDQASSFSLLDAFVDHGLNMVDTANVYSVWADGNQGGESETIIGNWFKATGKRDKIVLASKVGMEMGDGSKGLSPDYIIQSADASLKRLQTDYIDVYYAHCDDPSVPIEDTLGAFQQLIDAGKVRSIASSNFSAARLSQALQIAKEHNLPAYIGHQPEYNLYDRAGYEAELEKVCIEFGLGVATYYSLASGFLTGKYRSQEDLGTAKRGKEAVSKYMTPRGEKILTALDEVAAAHEVPVATVALAWIAHRPTVTAPIASATSVKQLEQTAAAATLALSEQDMNKLNAASAE